MLHDEVRQTVGRFAGVVQLRDVRVLEPRQCSTLVFEASQHPAGIEAHAEQFDRDDALEFLIRPFRAPDRAHAA
ncbi:MAG: hypothetical protein SGI72_04190 [Planctomycetota bacterium]|nr:hypothetical protein [Planctomycetota bacterium]